MKDSVENSSEKRLSPRSQIAEAAAEGLEKKKMPKSKDPRIVAPKLLGTRKNVDNFILYMARQESVDDKSMDVKTAKKTVTVQKNKKYFVSTLLKTLIVPGNVPFNVKLYYIV